jgi:hypothetical protein
MKKIAVIAAGVLSLGCLGAFEMPVLSVDTSVKFSTEHAFRGYRKARRSFLPKVEVGLPIFEKGKAYVGVDSALALGVADAPVNQINMNEVAPYVGLSYDVTDMFALDCGYIQRFWTNVPISSAGFTILEKCNVKTCSSEVYVGVTADVLLSPSVYLAYNFQWKEIAVEGRVAYTYDLAQFGVSGVAVELGAKVGYDKANEPYGVTSEKADEIAQQAPGWSDAVGIGIGKAHWFYGANADLVYSFNEHAKARAGVEVVGNSAKGKMAWQNGFGAHPKAMLWFNASVDCSF